MDTESYSRTVQQPPLGLQSNKSKAITASQVTEDDSKSNARRKQRLFPFPSEEKKMVHLSQLPCVQHSKA
jgi:hypothetical protein